LKEMSSGELGRTILGVQENGRVNGYLLDRSRSTALKPAGIVSNY
jgi:hypothetical protein